MSIAPFTPVWRNSAEWRAENKKTEMPCTWITSDLQLLLILTLYLVAGGFEFSLGGWQENDWWETRAKLFLSFLCLFCEAEHDKCHLRYGGWGFHLNLLHFIILIFLFVLLILFCVLLHSTYLYNLPHCPFPYSPSPFFERDRIN